MKTHQWDELTQPADPEEEVVGTLPANGWLVEYLDEDGLAIMREPILGWVVRRSGQTEAILLGRDGSGKPMGQRKTCRLVNTGTTAMRLTKT